MAIVHRRLYRLSNYRVISSSLLAFGLSLGAPRAAAAQPTAAAEARDDRELDGLLGRLTDGTPEARRAVADELIAGLEVSDIAAARQRLLAPTRVDLEQLRLKIIRLIRTVTDARPNADYDLLTLMVNAPRSHDLDWAIERVVLARGLGALASADAGRALIVFAGAHNALFRQEVGRIVRSSARDYVLPGIIEYRRPTELMRIFMTQLREALRRVTPGQTVQLRDNALLAEVLRAYGVMRQADAMRVVISFVNNDRTQVREGAREAVQQYGRDAIHALREAYEIYEGHDADPSWGWERVARELYAAYDRRREAEVLSRFDQGVTAGREGRGDDMVTGFRWVLARHPDFARRAEMVEPLMRFAQSLEQTDAARAESVWRLALWVAPEGPHAVTIRGAILYIEAERALARGVAEPELYRAVLRVDPNNTRARAQLARVAQDEVIKARAQRRALAALGLFVLAMATLWAMLYKPRSGPPSKGPGPRPEPAESALATVPD